MRVSIKKTVKLFAYLALALFVSFFVQSCDSKETREEKALYLIYIDLLDRLDFPENATKKEKVDYLFEHLSPIEDLDLVKTGPWPSIDSTVMEAAVLFEKSEQTDSDRAKLYEIILDYLANDPDIKGWYTVFRFEFPGHYGIKYKHSIIYYFDKRFTRIRFCAVYDGDYQRRSELLRRSQEEAIALLQYANKNDKGHK